MDPVAAFHDSVGDTVVPVEPFAGDVKAGTDGTLTVKLLAKENGLVPPELVALTRQ